MFNFILSELEYGNDMLWLVVNSTDKDTKHTKDQSTGADGYLEYTKEK